MEPAINDTVKADMEEMFPFLQKIARYNSLIDTYESIHGTNYTDSDDDSDSEKEITLTNAIKDCDDFTDSDDEEIDGEVDNETDNDLIVNIGRLSLTSSVGLM